MAKKGKDTSAVYKVIEIVGTSTNSFADAAQNGIKTASRSLRDLRVAEVDKLDVKIEGNKLIYRAKLKVSFKYHGED
ncbi:MAG TPA: dodecin family protein [Usitatibacter sp.]|jgi:flavin-binding protein dodecin|nr:dodecin family protein [Usitatibacter sp.]